MYEYIIKQNQSRKMAYNVHTGIFNYGRIKQIKKSEDAGIQAKQIDKTPACGMKMIIEKQFDTANKLL